MPLIKNTSKSNLSYTQSKINNLFKAIATEEEQSDQQLASYGEPKSYTFLQAPPPIRHSLSPSSPTHPTSFKFNTPRNLKYKKLTYPDGPNHTDAHQSLWPTSQTKPPADEKLRNCRSLFRIDDSHANASLPTGERIRRADTLQKAFARLGSGLLEHERAEAEARKAGIPYRDIILPHESAISDSETDNNGRGTKRQRLSHRGVPKGSTLRGDLSKLPDGYAIFQAVRPKTVKTSKLIDIYIYGSESIKRFDSLDSFIPHLYWLWKGKRVDVPCECRHCSRAR
jgi:hypothetical protein